MMAAVVFWSLVIGGLFLLAANSRSLCNPLSGLCAVCAAAFFGLAFASLCVIAWRLA